VYCRWLYYDALEPSVRRFEPCHPEVVDIKLPARGDYCTVERLTKNLMCFLKYFNVFIKKEYMRNINDILIVAKNKGYYSGVKKINIE